MDSSKSMGGRRPSSQQLDCMLRSLLGFAVTPGLEPLWTHFLSIRDRSTGTVKLTESSSVFWKAKPFARPQTQF